MKHYKGDILPNQAWQMLETSDAILVDVRTKEELMFVGKPSLEKIGKQFLHIEWQSLPNMLPNPNFIERLSSIVNKSQTLLFICRSGARSRQAAHLAAEIGYTTYNIAEGFEGDLDGQGHRGNTNGWKFAGLPWGQN